MESFEALRFAPMPTMSEAPTEWPDQHRSYYETLVEASPTAIISCDPGFIVTSWNPAPERVFGYTPSEAIGRHIDELVKQDSIRAEGEAVNERVFRRPNAAPHPVKGAARPVEAWEIVGLTGA